MTCVKSHGGFTSCLFGNVSMAEADITDWQISDV